HHPTTTKINTLSLHDALPILIENLRAKLDVPLSIDTSKAEVARVAIKAGASIVNDVTGGRGDDHMLPLIAQTKSALIIMHMQGIDRKSTRLNSSHVSISYAVF